MKPIVVIGGGAAGMIASIFAARQGASVIVLERMQRVGKKLLATGNGRCNIANKAPLLSRYHGGSPDFVSQVFSQFGLDDTLAFFDSIGVPLTEEADGKLFPMSQQASSVLDVLRHEMVQLGVVEICESAVQSIQFRRNGFQCVCSEGRAFEAGKVIIATGGKSSPNLGSNGAGFKLAQSLGHRIVEPFPALVQVDLDAPYLNQLAGVGLDGRVQARVNGKLKRVETGEMLFAKYGISGTAILQISRVLSEAVTRGDRAEIRIDLFPGTALSELTRIVRERISKSPGKPVDFSFVGFIHKRLIPVLLRNAGIGDWQRPCSDLSEDEILRIATSMKEWSIPCTGTQSWMNSQVTAGGVDVSEVNPDTLESRLVSGIHFAGEVLDVDGDSGGFNLQWAWSSGAVAGRSAATVLQ